eukprot:2042515-Ditylum_brightwellii.AAC.1
MSPQAVPSCKKGGCISDLDDVLASFPARKTGPRELHARKKAEQSFKGVCIYCSALYQQKKEAGNDILYQKAVRRTVFVCNYCSLKNEAARTCYL